MTEQEIRKAREAKNKYQREWRRKNPERVREQALRHWLRKAKAMEQQGQEGENHEREA